MRMVVGGEKSDVIRSDMTRRVGRRQWNSRPRIKRWEAKAKFGNSYGSPSGVCVTDRRC